MSLGGCRMAPRRPACAEWDCLRRRRFSVHLLVITAPFEFLSTSSTGHKIASQDSLFLPLCSIHLIDCFNSSPRRSGSMVLQSCQDHLMSFMLYRCTIVGSSYCSPCSARQHTLRIYRISKGTYGKTSWNGWMSVSFNRTDHFCHHPIVLNFLISYPKYYSHNSPTTVSRNLTLAPLKH